MLKSIVLGQLRHMFTVAAGTLVGAGYLQASQTEAAVGIALYAIGAAWSAYEKKAARK